MDRSNIFQISVIGGFVVLLILGFLGFAGYLPLPKGKEDINYGSITIWGTIPAVTMEKLIGDTISKDAHVKVLYTEKKKATFNTDFVEALARGDGPDLVLISQDSILKMLDKISLVPYTAMTERNFKNTFIQEGELFLRADGIAALPFTIDPLVMYWNRDMFNNALVVAPPAHWTEFYDLVSQITVRNVSGDIVKSLVSFGEYRNVSHAKEIVSLLLLQAGSPIVSTDANGALSPAFVIPSSTSAENPVMSAVRFFTEFSKPGKDAYSWNRSLPYSRTMFEAGDLALYFGLASEYRGIQAKNPHLNFDVTIVPQAGEAKTRLTFGQMQGLAMVKSSKNLPGALYAALLLVSKEVVGPLSALSELPPVRRDLIAVRPSNAAQSIFYDSALIARAWLDPSPNETDALFMDMFDGITSGRTMISEALTIAQSGMGKLLQVYRK